MPFQQRSSFAKFVGPQEKPVIDGALLTELSEAAVLENQSCARKVAVAASIWDSCIHQTIQIGDLITDAGNYAASETAKVLGCSKTVADTYAEIGMDLRLRLPAINAAFEAGELDLARVRAIYRTTAPLSLGAAERIEAEVLQAARRLSPGPLATEIHAIIQRTAPEEVAELREDLKVLVGVRYKDKDMIATIEANLEAADAAVVWQLVTEMAATLCPRDPRTRSQRLAAAYTACIRREEHLACTCEVDDDHPCTANPALPDRRVPLTSITIDLATLAGLSDLPAYLAGHGLIDASYARELAANSDWQIVIAEARDVADELQIPVDTTSDQSTRIDAPVDETPDERDQSGRRETGRESAADGEAVERESVNHQTFHPLGRGRRRRGLRVPTPTAERTVPTRIEDESAQYQGSYTLIAALEKAIAANPAVAHNLYPDGHGGFIEPPAGALQYKPRKAVADLVRHRDRTCRFPGCDVPALGCEIDHVIPFFHHDPEHGGWTVLTNLHCLCRYHHALKTMGAWHTTVLAGGIEYWESNSGTTAVTLPGSAVGTTDLVGETLTPHIPRKRRPKCGMGSTDTTSSDGSQIDHEHLVDPASDTSTDEGTADTAVVDPWKMDRPDKQKPGEKEKTDADDPAPF